MSAAAAVRPLCAICLRSRAAPSRAGGNVFPPPAWCRACIRSHTAAHCATPFRLAGGFAGEDLLYVRAIAAWAADRARATVTTKRPS